MKLIKFTQLAIVSAIFLATLLLSSAGYGKNISGIWALTEYRGLLIPIDAKQIPFSSEGIDKYKINMAALRKDPSFDKTRSLCVMQGMPRVLLEPYPFQIFQTESQVVFIHEANRSSRIIQVQDKHADSDIWDPSYMGDGIARLEKNVLIIDTNNFNEKTFLDDTGLPHSNKLHISERLRVFSKGQKLENVITIEDTVMYTKKWSTRLVFERLKGISISTDFVCGDAHSPIIVFSHKR